MAKITIIKNGVPTVVEEQPIDESLSYRDFSIESLTAVGASDLLKPVGNLKTDSFTLNDSVQDIDNNLGTVDINSLNTQSDDE